MHQWKIFLERADTDEPRRYLGIIQADSMSQALELASQWFEVPGHDLVAVQAETH